MGKKGKMNMAVPTPMGGWRVAWDGITDRECWWGKDTGKGKLIGGLRGGMVC